MANPCDAAITPRIELNSRRYLAARKQLRYGAVFFAAAYWLLVGWSMQQTWRNIEQSSHEDAQQSSARLNEYLNLSFDLANAIFLTSDISMEQVPDPYTTTTIIKPMAKAALHVFESFSFNDAQGEHLLAARPTLAKNACPPPAASAAAGLMQVSANAERLFLRYKTQYGWTPDLWLCAKLSRAELNDWMQGLNESVELHMGLYDRDSQTFLAQSTGLHITPSEVQQLSLAALPASVAKGWLKLPGEHWLQGQDVLLSPLANYPLLVMAQITHQSLLSAWFAQVKWLLLLSGTLMLVLIAGYIGILQFILALDFAATRDVLTKLYSRRHLLELGAQVQAMAARSRQPYTVVLVDADHFKSVNDRFGHAMGDTVLQGIASALQHSRRKSDLIGRYGGEEFVAILPCTNQQGAQIIVERLRLAVAEQVFKVGEQRLPVTVSLGYICDDGSQSLQDLLHAADLALYQAKAAGRNCAIEAAPLSSPA